MTTGPAVDWKEKLARLAPAFAERAAAYDDTDAFVAENYADLRAAKLFSALVPQELGGGGLPYSEVCALIRGLAHYCGSTALAFSMHQHLAGTALWNYRHGKPGETLLRAVAQGEKVLVSPRGDRLAQFQWRPGAMRRRIPICRKEAVRQRLRCR